MISYLNPKHKRCGQQFSKTTVQCTQTGIMAMKVYMKEYHMHENFESDHGNKISLV